MNPLIRQVTISLITGEYDPIVEWFNELWAELTVVNVDVYHKEGGEFIYYTNNIENKNQYIFFQDTAHGKFYCNSQLYWIPLASKFDLEYAEVQKITKVLVENAFQISLNSSLARVTYNESEIRQAIERLCSEDVIFYIDSQCAEEIRIAVVDATPHPFGVNFVGKMNDALNEPQQLINET